LFSDSTQRVLEYHPRFDPDFFLKVYQNEMATPAGTSADDPEPDELAEYDIRSDARNFKPTTFSALCLIFGGKSDKLCFLCWRVALSLNRPLRKGGARTGA
jgi:hypothetical protein